MEDKNKDLRDFIKDITKVLSIKDGRFKVVNLSIEYNDLLDELLKDVILKNKDNEKVDMLISYFEQQIELLNDLKKEFIK